jgi:hypothetical protein
MAGWDDFINAIQGGAKNVSDFAGSAGHFLGDVAQSIPRGVVNIGLSVDEASRKYNSGNKLETLRKIRSMSEEERNRLAKLAEDPNNKDGQAFEMLAAKKQLGDLSDATLNKREAELQSEYDRHSTYTADNDFAKFLIGGEKDETAQSMYKTSEDSSKWLEEQGMDPNSAGMLGAGIAAVGTVLDAPTGLSGIVKEPLKLLGKEGIKAMVQETGEQGIRTLLAKSMPTLTENTIKQIVPELVKASSTKAVKSVFKQYGKVISKDLSVKVGKEGLQAGIETGAKNVALDDKTVEGALVAANKLKTMAPSQYGEAADKLLGSLKSTADLKDVVKGSKFDAFKEQFVDKLSPVNDMVRTIETRLGRKLSTDDNPYELMRLYNGMPDMIQQRVSKLTSILKQAPDMDAVKIIGMGRQVKDRAGRGIESFITAGDADSAIKGVYERLGAQKFDQAAKVVDAVNDYNKQLLQELNTAGIISDDSLKAINEVGANYFSKFNVIDYIMKSESNKALFSKTGSYNTTKQTLNKILKGVKGMEVGTEVLDPIESIVKSTDYTMRAIGKNDIWHAFNRLADEVPDLIVRTREPDNVLQRIALSLDNKELRPIRNKLYNMVTTRGGWVRKLESQINQLEKKGLHLSLKSGGERLDSAGKVIVDRLGGTVPTSQIGKIGNVAKRIGDETVQGFMDVVNPQKLGSKDTGSFIRNLIENGKRSDIDRLKKMVGNRDAKMSQLLDDIGSMKSEFDDIAGTIRGNSSQIHELADAKIPEGMAEISGFGKGIQGKLAVPNEIADVFSGKSKAQQDYLTSMMGTVNSFVKQNFTSNNPAFALITNPIRDTKSFAMNAVDVGAGPQSIGRALAEGLWARTFGKGEVFERWVGSGGRSGFYANENSAKEMAQELSRAVSGKRWLGVKVAEVKTTKDLIREVTHVMTAPLRGVRDALHGAAGILEDAPRLAQFIASEKAGKSAKEAAFNSRNVTVDFQQAGRIGQTVNAWIPFLNARFQGSIKSVEAIKRDPARAATVYAALTAAPILLAAANNQRFPDVMKMIPDQDRDNNFVIVLGDAKDENGDFTQVIKIPKSDVDKILGNPLDQIARFAANDDPDTVAETLTNMIGNVLPFDTVRDDQFSMERTVSSLLPPLIKAPVEAVTNRNLYFGSDIVPTSLKNLPADEQVKPTTSPVAQFMAPLLGGGSPLVAENTIRNLSGSLLTKAPQDQLGGKLSGASANKMNDEFYSILDKTGKNKASASKYINEAIGRGDYAGAQQAAQAYNQYLIQQFTPFGKTYGANMTQELADLYSEQKIVLTNRSIKQRQTNFLQRQAAEATGK